MEDYISFILSIASEDVALKPCYGIVPNSELEEWIAPDLKGFENHGPVRFGNAAALQTQHQVRHRQAGAEPDAVLCLARDRVDGLRLRVGRGVLLLSGEPVGGQFGGTALQVGLHVQRHHVEVLAGEHDPLQDAELAAGRVQRVRGQVGADQLSHCRLLPAWPAAGGR